MLRDALAVETKIEQQRAAILAGRRAEIRARQAEIAANTDYDALREQAAAAVWAVVERSKGCQA